MTPVKAIRVLVVFFCKNIWLAPVSFRLFPVLLYLFLSQLRSTFDHLFNRSLPILSDIIYFGPSLGFKLWTMASSDDDDGCICSSHCDNLVIQPSILFLNVPKISLRILHNNIKLLTQCPVPGFELEKALIRCLLSQPLGLSSDFKSLYFSFFLYFIHYSRERRVGG